MVVAVRILKRRLSSALPSLSTGTTEAVTVSSWPVKRHPSEHPRTTATLSGIASATSSTTTAFDENTINHTMTSVTRTDEENKQQQQQQSTSLSLLASAALSSSSPVMISPTLTPTGKTVRFSPEAPQVITFSWFDHLTDEEEAQLRLQMWYTVRSLESQPRYSPPLIFLEFPCSH